MNKRWQVLNDAGLTVMADLLTGTGLAKELEQGKYPALVIYHMVSLQGGCSLRVAHGQLI